MKGIRRKSVLCQGQVSIAETNGDRTLNIEELKVQLGAMAKNCNPSYSGGRDGEDLGSRTAQAKSLQYPS
jgi:hypothetical protein